MWEVLDSNQIKWHLALIGFCRLREFLTCKLLFIVTVFNVLAAMFSCKFAAIEEACTPFLGDNFV